ncbi:sigma 54-interacting transcriptional regulator [Nannocystis radixulma]|uniref:Sigma 54-interacting transcriptional regulator n=1 Tax=Nannocystis radixulma TaxID=2995305 RepID=A0ABT5B1Z6_9BACT|nr:sigma 54-interacting transcriptional regulator [Nannocystis radixulma]MDC0668112.1 sigma 54-interacting transcriptional regulator [Nannocystis radixulma]
MTTHDDDPPASADPGEGLPTRPLTSRGPGRSMRRLGRVNLRVCEGPDRGREVSVDLEEKLSIKGGRGAVNELVLADDHISNSHFELVRTSRGVLLRDLGSLNGIYLGPHRVREVWIEPGTVFRAGQTQIQLVAAEAVEVPLATTDQFEELLGRSPAMRAMFARLERIAQHKNPRVLVSGETGSGKELVARSLHRRSARSAGPYVARDCATIPRELAESILFGFRRGAFTGAVADTRGCFEEAHGGTLFLDEIGELPLELQAKLLRVLEQKEVVRVGEHRPRPVDVRVVFATHRDLQHMVSEGHFREDLWHRINGFPVAVPPLREREGDVRFLAEAFLAACIAESGTHRVLTEETCRALEAHTWPGNVRELRSVIERAYWLAEGDAIAPVDLDLIAEPRGRASANEWFLHPHAAAVGEFERAYFTELLARFPTKVLAARAAGLTPEGLRLALKRLGLRP